MRFRGFGLRISMLFGRNEEQIPGKGANGKFSTRN